MINIKDSISYRLGVYNLISNNTEIQNKVNSIVDIILSSDILLVGGNGGSASDSSHFVGELIGRFNNITNPFPAINMTCDIAYLTAVSNDISFDDIFVQYIDAFSKMNTSYLFISTSGKSKNIISAIDRLVKKYNHKKIMLITGKDVQYKEYDGNLLVLNIPTNKTEYIQEAYISILHEIANEIKLKLTT